MQYAYGGGGSYVGNPRGGGSGSARDFWGNSSSFDNSAVTAADAQKYIADQKNNRWNQLLGQIQSVGSPQPYTPGPAANITVRGVWNPQQTQQQVSAMRATNDKSTATQNQKAASDLAGRGFGSNSPLLMALQGANNASNMAANTAGERQIRYGAQQGNVQNILATQTAAANAEAQRQQQALTARGQTLNSYNALLAALSGSV